MSLFKTLLALWVVVGFSSRDVFQKLAAKKFRNDHEAGAIASIFMIIGILISFFFLSQNLKFPINSSLKLSALLNSSSQEIFIYHALIIGILKGIIVFKFNSKARNLDISAVSGATYLGFASLSIGSLFNYYIFNENIKVIPVIGLSLIAIIFYLLGPGKKIIHDKKSSTLLKAIFLLAILMPLDFIGLKASNWYIHLIISNNTSFVFFLFLLRSKNIVNLNFLKNKYIILSGLFYVIMEFSFVFSFSILGVSYAFLFGMLSYLPTMLYGSIKYKEGTWYFQIFYCLMALFFVYIIAF